MRAVVYHGPGDKRWEEVADPKLIDDTDAIVRVDTTTICGTDLHILKGDVPEVTPGRILGHEAVVLNGRVQPGDTVAVVGAGPIGLATILGAKLYSPAAIVAIDPAPARREWASTFGATEVATPEQAGAVIERLTDGLGADVAVEAVGIPETFEQATTLIRPGGRVANVGVHGKPATLHLESLWIRNVTITTGLVDTFSTPTLLRAVTTGQLDPTRFTTHRYPLDHAIEAYDTFARAGDTNALKVLLTGSQSAARL